MYQVGFREDNYTSKEYHYITPAYTLVKDGKILNNHPVLPKDKKGFLGQL